MRKNSWKILGMAKAARKTFVKRLMLVAVLCMVFCLDTFASTTVGSSLSNIGTQLRTYIEPIQMVVDAAAILIGLVGAGRCFYKWNSGDQDVMKSVMSWGASFIFLMAAATVLPSIFG